MGRMLASFTQQGKTAEESLDCASKLGSVFISYLLRYLVPGTTAGSGGMGLGEELDDPSLPPYGVETELSKRFATLDHQQKAVVVETCEYWCTGKVIYLYFLLFLFILSFCRIGGIGALGFLTQ